LPLLRVTVTQCGQIALTHLSTTAVACMPYLTQESLSDQPSQCKPDVKETPSTFLRQGEDDLWTSGGTKRWCVEEWHGEEGCPEYVVVLCLRVVAVRVL